mgnify:FL=1
MQDSNMIEFPKTIDITLKSDVSKSFRCKLAANSLDIDVEKKSVHHLKIEGVRIPESWNVGLIVGASGSGKTTTITQLFGASVFQTLLNEDLPIIEQLPKEYSYDQCAAILSGIGLTSVPCWIRPVKTLSNGQKARAEAALLMCQDAEIVFIDEWTSVVDRTVAKAMSVCISKHAKKQGKKIVLLSCHYDIIEWLSPDWLIDCNSQSFHLPSSQAFFFSEREKLTFDIREIGRESWRYFSKYHYLSNELPGGKLYLYGLFHGENQIGFQCFANYVPHSDKRKKIIYHSNRVVIHPDYSGIGLGIKLSTECAKILQSKVDCRIMAKFSSTPMYKSRIKSDQWRFLGVNRVFGKMHAGNTNRTVNGDGTRDERSAFRDKGVKTYQFEYIGNGKD